MRVIVVGVCVVCRCGSCHLLNPALRPLKGPSVPSPLSLKPREPYCAAAPAEAKLLPGLVANFFFAPSTQVANSWSETTRTAIGMKA
jgi:hypothetical protein